MRVGTMREIFRILSAEIGRQLRRRGVSEEEVLADFAAWRKAKRQTSHSPELA